MNSTQNDKSKVTDKKKEYKKTKQFLRKKERTKQAILAAAKDFYTDKSIDEIVLDDIAEAAYVSRTTIFNYFQNKDELFFALGNYIFKQENEFIRKNVPVNLSGKDQVLFLCEKTFKDSIEKPVLLKTIKEFFERLNREKENSAEILNEITKKLGASTLNDLVEGKTPLENVDFENSFENPYFIEFFIQLMKNGNIWIQIIRKGKKDMSIKNELEDIHITQHVNMLMNGMVSEMELRKKALDRVGIKRETIVSNSLNLIEVFLINKTSV